MLFAEIPTIPLPNLALAFLPVAVVVAIVFRWSLGGWDAMIAMVRMLAQLLLVGYVLLQIFNAQRAWIVLAVILLMILAASWIALGPLKERRPNFYLRALASITLGGGVTLLAITQTVLDLQPWFEPKFMVPIAGMIFFNAMNAVSLAAERYESERANGNAYLTARRAAMRAALIPTTNALLAVGIVSLPGMMTGQIIAGVSPLVAARYQVMVMCMVYGSAGMSAACYMLLVQPRGKQAQEAGVAENRP